MKLNGIRNTSFEWFATCGAQQKGGQIMHTASKCKVERLFVLLPMWTVAWILLAAGMFSGTAWADVFDYNVITPGQTDLALTGPWLVGPPPLQTGPYAGLQEWGLQIPGQTVPLNPNSNLPCDVGGGLAGSGLCYDDEYFFSADGSYLGASPGIGSVEFPGLFLGGPGGVVIDDSGGDPLAVMWFGCGPEAVCDMTLIAAAGGPINLATLPVPFDALDAPRIAAVGGAQDAIDVNFYDGNSASFGFVLTTPEPASVLLLASVLMGLGLAAKRKFRPSNET